MGLTIKDIAKMANTSTATISRTIHGLPGVGEEKRRQMLELLDRIGYRPNRIAQNLVSGHSGTIGIITSNLKIPFYLDSISHIEHLFREKGYQILVLDSNHDLETEKTNIEMLRQYRTEGILLIPEYDYNMKVNLDHLTRLRLENYPFVLIGKTPQHDVDWVTVEETECAYQLTSYLLDHGHKKIGFLGNDSVNRTVVERLAGIRGALQVRGLHLADADVIDEVGTWGEGGEQAWQDVIVDMYAQLDAPTALICANDTIALIIISQLQSIGLKVPGDVSVTGFDDSPWSRFVHPSITTCAKDMATVGRLAVEILFDRMEHPDGPARQHSMPQQLIIRDSSGPCRERRTTANTSSIQHQ